MRMYLGSEWVYRDQTVEVFNPYTGQPIDTVPRAGIEDVDLAIKSAERGFQQMKQLSAFDRYEFLMKAVALTKGRKEDIASTLSAEEGKTINEARVEVDRCVQTLTWSAEEAKRLRGETIPLNASPGNETKFGFTVRVPVGIVAAISPFNFPLNLVAHKVGPALAAGDSRTFFVLALARAVLMVGCILAGLELAGLMGALLGIGAAYVLAYPVVVWLARRMGAWDPLHDALFALVALLLAALAVTINWEAIVALA